MESTRIPAVRGAGACGGATRRARVPAAMLLDLRLQTRSSSTSSACMPSCDWRSRRRRRAWPRRCFSRRCSPTSASPAGRSVICWRIGPTIRIAISSFDRVVITRPARSKRRRADCSPTPMAALHASPRRWRPWPGRDRRGGGRLASRTRREGAAATAARGRARTDDRRPAARDHASAARLACTVARAGRRRLARRLFSELARRDDSLLVFGGFGDPLLHPRFPAIRPPRAAGRRLRHRRPNHGARDGRGRTRGALRGASRRRLPLLDAHSPAMYERVHRSDGFARAVENASALLAKPAPAIIRICGLFPN